MNEYYYSCKSSPLNRGMARKFTEISLNIKMTIQKEYISNYNNTSMLEQDCFLIHFWDYLRTTSYAWPSKSLSIPTS